MLCIYIKAIREAVENLCDNNTTLLTRQHKTENSCQFIIAKYISDKLANFNNNFFIDCEFRVVGSNLKRANGNTIQPDIIYHDRGNNNIFVLEIKLGGTKNSSNFKDDRAKVFHCMRSIGYTYGFCLSHIHNKSYRLHIVDGNFITGNPPKGQAKTLKYKKINNKWLLKNKKYQIIYFYI